ncbi:HesB family protein (plasmid) [Legionella adelaidensis]|uniref:HesB family protein n=1 Tax=Legionella adelaidensis TaxID=45056 RepID=A0A0W0R4W8_9GAMM|nr:iron-sulfur cluster assembly accessory protein [Legionella adelaidensis]KTC66112.1 HesB family transporter protein [Legionella adelaidensis]VEH85818.1 HesB family protein [Legionella adelaidensis]
MSDVIQVNSSKKEIVFTESALKYIASYLQKQGGKGIRLSVKKTGCSGLSYVVEYVAEPSDKDIVSALANDYLLCIDKNSYPYLQGMMVDYVKQGLNTKFVFNNPNQTGQCGCGESFTVG